MLKCKGFCSKLWNIHFIGRNESLFWPYRWGEALWLPAGSYFSYRLDISFWNTTPWHDHQQKQNIVLRQWIVRFCFFFVIFLLRLFFSGVTPPVVSTGLSFFLSSLTPTSIMFPLLECAEPKHEVPGKNSLRPAGEWVSELFILLMSKSRPQDLIDPPQNKVLAIIDAIEAAQFLISQNATHVVNRVRITFFLSV